MKESINLLAWWVATRGALGLMSGWEGVAEWAVGCLVQGHTLALLEADSLSAGLVAWWLHS